MPEHTPSTPMITEPMRRFYPSQGEEFPVRPPVFTARENFPAGLPDIQKNDDACYFSHRHPILLQRLYAAADAQLDTYPKQSFLYDAYPDYLSLRLLRDRILRENRSLTEDFLQDGCPIFWLQLLTDTVLSELICRKRRHYRNPMGDASTTSVQSVTRS